MIPFTVEFEDTFETEMRDLFNEIRLIEDSFKKENVDACLSYFPYDKPIWRFDWGFIYKTENTDLIKVLEDAISFGKNWLKS